MLLCSYSQEAAARHEAERLEQEARGRLERQKIEDEAEAEKSKEKLLQLQVPMIELFCGFMKDGMAIILKPYMCQFVYIANHESNQ